MFLDPIRIACVGWYKHLYDLAWRNICCNCIMRFRLAYYSAAICLPSFSISSMCRIKMSSFTIVLALNDTPFGHAVLFKVLYIRKESRSKQIQNFEMGGRAVHPKFKGGQYAFNSKKINKNSTVLSTFWYLFRLARGIYHIFTCRLNAMMTEIVLRENWWQYYCRDVACKSCCTD